MMNTQTKPAIAVRLYENRAYGTTYGKNLYRKALYNGTVEAMREGRTYLVDFYRYEDWANMARSDADMEVLANVPPQTDSLYSWIKHYDRTTKQSVSVSGVCQLDTLSLQLSLMICDESRGFADMWELGARPCRQQRQGINSPQLLATNADLSVA